MKVLVLTLWYPNAENPILGTFVHEQVIALKAEGMDVKVVHPIPFTPFPIRHLKEKYKRLADIPREERYKGVDVLHPRYIDLPMHLLYSRVGRWMYQGTAKIIMKIHKEWNFDIIHSHGTYPCGWCANLIRDRHLKKIKSVHTIHRVSIIDVPRYSRGCFDHVKNSLRAADWTVFVSMEGYRLGMDFTDGLIDGKSSYITNGVNATQFLLSDEDEKEVTALKAKFGDSLNILFIGYLIERKGIKELLSAYRELRRTEESVRTRLFLVGRNMMGSYVSNFIERNGLGGDVVITGPVLHDHVKRWLKFADIFVLPSHSEGLATVLFESLYMKRPSIFTRVGGTCDIVKDMEHAVLINAGSEEELLNALRLLIKDISLRERLGKNGHNLIRNKYTWKINAEKNVQVYRNVCGETGASYPSQVRHQGNEVRSIKTN